MTKRNFEIRAAQDTLDILIYGPIGSTWDDSGVTAKDIADALKDQKNTKTINVSINSAGGNVFDGIAIYNLLANQDGKVVVSIDGMALSIASIIAMAGDEIVMAENAMMMIHDPAGWVVGVAADMLKMAETLEKSKSTLVLTYARRTGQSESQVSEWMTDETWLTAEEAVEFGFATRTMEAKKIAACGDLSRFKNAPEAFLSQLREKAPAASAAASDRKEDPMDPKELEKAQAASEAKGKADAKVENDKRVAELTAAFPNEAEFVLAQVSAGHDVTQAKAAFCDVLAERNAKLATDLDKAKTENAMPGVADAGGGGKAGEASVYEGDAIATVDAAVTKKVAAGMPRNKAHSAVMRGNPELRAAYVEAKNAQRVPTSR